MQKPFSTPTFGIHGPMPLVNNLGLSIGISVHPQLSEGSTTKYKILTVNPNYTQNVILYLELVPTCQL